MVTSQENELLTATGAGTVMGNFIRQYWIPALHSYELPDPDCPPVRIRLLSEDLVAFRTTSGKVGLLEAYCPHRRTDLFHGRNEEEGLRCVFHGWKWDISGACVDLPSEVHETSFTTKVRAVAYPCVERGGVIWTYMGPRTTPPPLPDIEGNMTPGSNEAFVLSSMMNCNWLQMVENGLDTVHTAFLHNGSIRAEDDADSRLATPNNESAAKYIVANRAIKIVSEDTDYGCHYAAYRPAEEDSYLWRIAGYFFPFYSLGPTNKLGTGSRFNAYVPLDDTHTMVWTFHWHKNASAPKRSDFLPNTSDFLGRFRPAVTKETDYGLDRELQRNDHTYKGFTGIPVFNDQDRAATELQGQIFDRTREHLSGSDQMLVRTRRRLLQVANELHEHGVVPPGVDVPSLYRERGGWIVLPRAANVWEETEELRHSVMIDDDSRVISNQPAAIEEPAPSRL